MGFGKKVWKVRNAEPDGGCTRIVKGNQKDMDLVGGSGSSPPEKFWIWGPQMEYSKAFLGQSTPIPIPLPPKKISLQIYTDLKNGPGSWKILKSEDSVPWKSHSIWSGHGAVRAPSPIPNWLDF